MSTAGEKLGYFVGLDLSKRPYEAPLKTNQGDFQTTAGDPNFPGAYYAVGSRLPRKNSRQLRMAGDIMNLDLVQSPGTLNAPALPVIGSAEMRTPELPQ
jgi:hypothetical protein